MNYDTINTDAELMQLCDRLRAAPAIAFDTEFVSEDTYWSQLCLIQVATSDVLAVIDPLQLGDVTPFWQLLAEGEHETIVHSGREELVFSLSAIGRRPANLFDVQLAAGLVGYEYPAGYASLVYKLTGQRPPKGETRTDWRRRPLTSHQLEYALADAVHLLPMHRLLRERLGKLARMPWIEAEMEAWQSDVEDYLARPRWRRVSGISGLSGKGLAIVRELWQWREEEAKRRDIPVRRILRDDLMVELAKRATAEPNRISAIRGLERSGAKRYLAEISKCIRQALEHPEQQLPRSVRGDMPGQIKLLGQFLSSALTSICRRAQVAPSLVGTASDVRDLIAQRLGLATGDEIEPLALATGWRADVVGHLIEDLLAGKVSIRIDNPRSDEPLVFEPYLPDSTAREE